MVIYSPLSETLNLLITLKTLHGNGQWVMLYNKKHLILADFGTATNPKHVCSTAVHIYAQEIQKIPKDHLLLVGVFIRFCFLFFCDTVADLLCGKARSCSIMVVMVLYLLYLSISI